MTVPNGLRADTVRSVARWSEFASRHPGWGLYLPLTGVLGFALVWVQHLWPTAFGWTLAWLGLQQSLFLVGSAMLLWTNLPEPPATPIDTVWRAAVNRARKGAGQAWWLLVSLTLGYLLAVFDPSEPAGLDRLLGGALVLVGIAGVAWFIGLYRRSRRTSGAARQTAIHAMLATPLERSLAPYTAGWITSHTVRMGVTWPGAVISVVSASIGIWSALRILSIT